jgi:hypothetical protein
MMPATDTKTMLAIDLPLVIGTTGSLATFYAMAEMAQGRRSIDAIRQLPALLALGAGLAPHLTRAVWEGLRSMAGEFIRTPKKGSSSQPLPLGRYRASADLPAAEIALCLLSAASTVASIATGHWFATPFAMLFTFGYGYVAFFVASEELARRRAQLGEGMGMEAPPAVADAGAGSNAGPERLGGGGGGSPLAA